MSVMSSSRDRYSKSFCFFLLPGSAAVYIRVLGLVV